MSNKSLGVLIVSIVGLVVGVLLIVIGFLFKIQHWPSASLLMLVGIFLSIGSLISIALSIIRRRAEKEYQDRNLNR